MTFDRRAYETNAEWRKATLVVSFPNWGDNGRMLHRPSCRYLTIDRRLDADMPAKVYSENAKSWERGVKQYGSYTKFHICKVCCSDLIGILSESDGKGAIWITASQRCFRGGDSRITSNLKRD